MPKNNHEIPISINLPDPQIKKKVVVQSNQSQLDAFRQNLQRQKPLYNLAVNYLRENENLFLKKGEVQCYIHSQYDKKREMEQMFLRVDPEIEYLFLFGVGNASAVVYAARKFKNLKQLFVVEPSVKVLTTMLRKKKFIDRIAKISKITFIYNKTPEDSAATILENIKNNLKSNMGFAYHLSYRTLFEGYYEKLQEAIISGVRNFAGNLATIDHNIYFKTQNVLYNLNESTDDAFKILQVLKDKPAIIVSAGPSLDKNIHLLEEAKKKACVIPVGSTNKILHNKGIRPHIRSAFSPFPDENVVFDGIDDFEGIPLIYGNNLDHFVVEDYDAPKAMIVLAGDLFSRAVYDYAHIQYQPIGGSGTIANVTFDLLSQIGCSHIILTGQDLCYTKDKLYADGSWSDPKIVQKAGLLEVDDMNGQAVFTSKTFLNLKIDFETMIKRYSHKGIAYYNCTEGGLNIEGAQNMALEEVLSMLPEFDFDALITDAFKQVSIEKDDDKIVKILTLFRDEIESIWRINHQRKEALQNILGDESRDVRLIYNDLVKCEHFEQELMKNNFYRKIVLPEINSQLYIIKMDNQYSGNDILEKAKSLSNTLVGYTSKIFEYTHFLHETIQNVLEEKFD